MIYGGASGNMMIGDDIGHCQTMASTQKPIKALFYSFEDQSVVVVSSDAVLFVFSIQRDGTLAETKKVSTITICGKTNIVDSYFICSSNCRFKVMVPTLSLIGPLTVFWSLQIRRYLCDYGILRQTKTMSCRSVVRFDSVLNTQKKESRFIFFMWTDPRHMAKAKDTIDTISYNPRKRMMAGGTAMGRIVMWKYAPRGHEPSELDWQVRSHLHIVAIVHFEYLLSRSCHR